MIFDKMYELLLGDLKQIITQDVIKILEERDIQYHNYFTKMEVMAQKINDLHNKLNSISRLGNVGGEKYLAEQLKLINGFGDGLNNVYQEFQDFRKDTIAAFVNLGVTVDRIDQSNRQQSIRELDMTVRTTNCLLAENIYTVGELCNCTESDLLKTPNFGKRCLQEVKDTLAELGLKLKDR